jgi:hypothetical protein
MLDPSGIFLFRSDFAITEIRSEGGFLDAREEERAPCQRSEYENQ